MSDLTKIIKPISNAIINIIKFNMKKNKLFVNKVQQKIYCIHCKGKGYAVCPNCVNGCSNCNYMKFSPCIFCSGLGFNGYNYL